MIVFISHSGKRSKVVAETLRKWLPNVFPLVRPWVSSVDISAGSRWWQALGSTLDESNFGILCLTPENVAAPWVLYEAGALSKSMHNGVLIPYLLDVEVEELPPPIAQFQSVLANADGTKQLMFAIRDALETDNMSDSNISRLHEESWPNLEEMLKRCRKMSEPYSRSGDPLSNFIATPAAKQALERDVNDYVNIEQLIQEKKKGMLSRWTKKAEIEELERRIAEGEQRILKDKYRQIAVIVREPTFESEKPAIANLMDKDGKVQSFRPTRNFDIKVLNPGDIGIAKIRIVTTECPEVKRYQGGLELSTGKMKTIVKETLASFEHELKVKADFEAHQKNSRL